MPPAKPQERARRSFALDPRFIVGVVLVVASVAAVVWLVQTADQSEEIYVASSTLTTGEQIDRDDLAVVRVRLGQSSSHYLDPDRFPEQGLVAVRPIGEGELVPMDAVGTVRGEDEARLVVTVAGPLPSAVGEASRVTLWASAANTTGTGFAAPVVLASNAQVVTILKPTGLIAAGREVQVELRVPREAVAAVLEATANGAALAIVPDDEPVAP
jgi:hypothetical protein